MVSMGPGEKAAIFEDIGENGELKGGKEEEEADIVVIDVTGGMEEELREPRR